VSDEKEITIEELRNMNEREFMELMGAGKIKTPGRLYGRIDLSEQRRREARREMSRKGEIPRGKPNRDEFGRPKGIVKSPIGMGYSADGANVENPTTLLDRQPGKRGADLADMLRDGLNLE
jgi:hypothetical protein